MQDLRKKREELGARFIAEAEEAMGETEIYGEAKDNLSTYLQTLSPFLKHRPYPGDLQGLKVEGFHFLKPSDKLRFIAPAFFYPYFRAWLRREGYEPKEIEGVGWWAERGS